jgi:hypothetical protein
LLIDHIDSKRHARLPVTRNGAHSQIVAGSERNELHCIGLAGQGVGMQPLSMHSRLSDVCIQALNDKVML